MLVKTNLFWQVFNLNFDALELLSFILDLTTVAYSEPCQTSKMECFAKMMEFLRKRSILDVWQGPKYAFEPYFHERTVTLI